MRRVAPMRCVLALVLALTCAFSGSALALAMPVLARADETYSADAEPQVSAPVAFLIDRTTGTVLLDKDSDAMRYPASTTKVMTALVVLEHANLDDQVTVQESDFDEVTWDSSVAGLKAGETLTVRDLMACLLIPSGNDAAYVLARAVGGTWQDFVQMMNDKATELGCQNTHFANPCGLHDDNHYTCARDLATIFAAALEHPEFQEIAGSASWDLPATEQNPARTLESTDSLVDPESAVYMGDEVLAAKTGYTDRAGRCLVAAGERDDMSVIGVVMGASPMTDAQGVGYVFNDMYNLMQWGFGAWQTGALISAGDVVAQADVTLSTDGDSVGAASTATITATVPRGTTFDDLTVTPSWTEAFQAPLEQGDSLGTASVSLGDRSLGTIDLVAEHGMGLSILDFLMWWLTVEPWHMVVVVVGVVLLFVVVGLATSNRSRRRRRRSRYQVSSRHMR